MVGGFDVYWAQRCVPPSMPCWNALTRVAELEHAGEALVEIAGIELEQLAVTVVDVLHPRAGEAVGLLLGQDGGGELGPRLGLDHVTPLVRQHLRECERAELLVQAREEILVVVVDGHVQRAMERVVLEVLVRGAATGALGDRRHVCLRRVRVDVARRKHRVADAVHGRHLLGPEVLDVLDRRLEDLVVRRRRGPARRRSTHTDRARRDH